MDDISQITMIERYGNGQVALRDICEKFKIHRTTVWRQLKALRLFGRAGLVHKLKGRPSNRSKPEEIRRRVLEAWEQGNAPRERGILGFYRSAIRLSDLNVSYTTVRRWLKSAGKTES
ncbi:MAG TPA: HTH domain-containing protein [bacterium]|nr:HTH domain-containing protein [bacterium]